MDFCKEGVSTIAEYFLCSPALSKAACVIRLAGSRLQIFKNSPDLVFLRNLQGSPGNREWVEVCVQGPNCLHYAFGCDTEGVNGDDSVLGICSFGLCSFGFRPKESAGWPIQCSYGRIDLAAMGRVERTYQAMHRTHLTGPSSGAPFLSAQTAISIPSNQGQDLAGRRGGARP